jgi:hypothetical protein
MIPASYLFRNYYEREWLEDRAPTPPEQPRSHEGLAQRIAAAIPAPLNLWPYRQAADPGHGL